MDAGTAAAAPLSVAEAKAFLRLDTDAEDALISGLVRTATALCEAFTGQLLLKRTATETVAADGTWHALALAPVVSIGAVETLGVDGTATALAGDGWTSTVDADGRAWVRIAAAGVARANVTGIVGLADDWNGVPEPLRQGIARLVAHLFASRDAADDVGPPAAVAALWRPWRGVRLA